jgi:hypothetical protein
VASYTGTFETGVNGNAVVTGDAGSATQWSEVNDPANVTVTYSNVQFYETLSCAVTCDATGGQGYVGWGTSTIVPAFSGTHYGRIYAFYSGARPSASHFLTRGFTTAGSLAWEIITLNTGIIIMRDAGGTIRCTFTVPVNANAWFRFEWQIVQSTTAGVIEGKLFLSADSLTVTETKTSTGSFSTGTETQRYRFGSVASNVPNLLVYIDNIMANDTGYPGPLFPPVVSEQNLAPVIYGRGAA